MDHTPTKLLFDRVNKDKKTNIRNQILNDYWLKKIYEKEKERGFIDQLNGFNYDYSIDADTYGLKTKK